MKSISSNMINNVEVFGLENVIVIMILGYWLDSIRFDSIRFDSIRLD